MVWKVKLDEEGHGVVVDGLPVFVDENGQEKPQDLNQFHSKILELNQENRSRKERIKELEAKLAPFADIEDSDRWLARARKALDTLKNLDDKALVDAQQVDKLKEEWAKTFTAKEAKLRKQLDDTTSDMTARLTKKEEQIRNLIVSNQFATSPYFSGSDPKTTLPAEVAESHFGRHFQVEEQNGTLTLVAYDAAKNPILSRERMGEPASFNEAIQILLDQFPGKDRILRTGNAGSGSGSGQGRQRSESSEVQDFKALTKRLEEARARGDAATCISLKRMLFNLQQSAQGKPGG